MAQAVDRLQPEKPGRLGKRLAREGQKFRPVQRRQADIVPADHLRDVVKIAAVGDALAQDVPLSRVAQPGSNGVRPACQKVLRQQVQQLRRACAVGIDVTRDVQPLVPRLLQQRQRLRDAAVPVARAHGLEMADVHGRAEQARRAEHLPQGVADHVALLAHVHADGNAAALQRGQRPEQAVRRVEALRRIAEAERDTEGPVRQRTLQTAVQLRHGLIRIARRIAAAVRAHRPAANEHADVQRQRPGAQCVQIGHHGLRGDGRVDVARDRPEIAPQLRPVRRAERRKRQAAVSVDDGGQPLPQLRAAEAGAEDGGIAVAVDVQKARRDVPPGRVQRLRGLAAGPDSRDLPAADADIRPERRAAVPIDDRAPANDPIQHEYLLLNTFIIAYFPGKSTRTVDFCRDVGYNKENPSSEVTPMAVKIEKDTIIGDVLDLAPETAPLFQAIGMHCLGCPASRGESVEEACMVHGVDPDAFLAQVNHFIEAVEANK